MRVGMDTTDPSTRPPEQKSQKKNSKRRALLGALGERGRGSEPLTSLRECVFVCESLEVSEQEPGSERTVFV